MKLTNYEKDLARDLKSKTAQRQYKAYGRQLTIAYKLAEMRAKAKLSQAELASKIGTKQSNVARMESGEQNFTLSTLDRLAEIFGKTLEVNFA